MQQFAGRRDVLKARAALAVVDDVLRTDHRDGSDALGAELERITAGAHDLVELPRARSRPLGAIPVREEERDAVERLLGRKALGRRLVSGSRPTPRLPRCEPRCSTPRRAGSGEPRTRSRNRRSPMRRGC